MQTRPLRRSEREISTREAEAILTKALHGVLSTIGSDGQPYGVPLNYVYRDSSIYFHCALGGHKIDNIEHNPKVSFCVVGDTKVLPEKFSMLYESVIVFGTASAVDGPEKHNALIWLSEKYCPGFLEEGRKYIDQKDEVTKVIKIEINHMSGKARL